MTVLIDLVLSVVIQQIPMVWKSAHAPNQKLWLKDVYKWAEAERGALVSKYEQAWDEYLHTLKSRNDDRPPRLVTS